MKKYNIGLEIRALMIMIRRSMDADTKEQNEEQNDITRMNCWIICYLFDKLGEDIFQKDIEDQFLIRRSTATNILKLMEKKGLIEKSQVPYDARLKKIILTDKALLIHKLINKRIDEFECKLQKNIPESELEGFCLTLEKFKNNIK